MRRCVKDLPDSPAASAPIVQTPDSENQGGQNHDEDADQQQVSSNGWLVITKTPFLQYQWQQTAGR